MIASRSWNRVVAGILLLASGARGIAAPGAASGAAAYSDRVLTGHVAGDMYQAAQGTKSAAARLRLATVKGTGDEAEARLVAYDPHGTKIVINLRPAASNLTLIRIRVGLSGDERYSRRILAEIRSRLL